MSISATDLPFMPPSEIEIALPKPLSVNRTRRIDWRSKKKQDAWTAQADKLVMLHGKPKWCITKQFEAHIVYDESVKIDLDGGLKILIDYCRRIEAIADDSPKYMRRLIVEFGDAPTGARIVLREIG